jgi:hypothetical protein
VAAAPLGAARTLRASAGHQPHLGDGNGGDRRRTEAGPLLSAVPGDHAECTAVDPSMEAAELDRVGVADPAASVGDRGVSGTQRRRLLGAAGTASHGQLHLVLHLACDLQRAPDDGRDHLSSEALLALC